METIKISGLLDRITFEAMSTNERKEFVKNDVYETLTRETASDGHEPFVSPEDDGTYKVHAVYDVIDSCYNKTGVFSAYLTFSRGKGASVKSSEYKKL